MLTALFLSSVALPALTAAELLGEGFIKYDILAKELPAGALSRRQTPGELTQQQSGTSYTIELGVGSPAQPVEVQLDTGSTDLWVNPNCDRAGIPPQVDFCNSLPRFDPESSTSFTSLESADHFGYGAQASADIVWATDDVSVGAAELQSQRFGVATDSINEPFGILGVGPKPFANSVEYTFFIDNLVEQGFTESRAFGLDIRSIEEPDGSIIFGGLDTGKYIGNLEKLPIVSGPSGSRYWIQLDSFGIKKAGEAPQALLTTPLTVLLDSGTTLIRLPMDIYTAFGESFPTAVYDQGSGMYIVDCDVAQEKGTVDFTFGSKVIKVQYKDVIWIASKEQNLCALGASGIPPNENPAQPMLGDSFMRAAYCVFDQDNHEIHIAQGANCGTNVVAITKGPNAVPSVPGDCPPLPDDDDDYPPPTSTPYGNNTAPYPTNTTAKLYPTSYPTITTTYTTTTCYTVTKCPDYVADCPLGHYTTETITTYSTYCPEPTKKPFVPCTTCGEYFGHAQQGPAPTYAAPAWTPSAPAAGSNPTPTYPAGSPTYPAGSPSYPAVTYPAAATPSKAVVAGAGRVAARAGAALAAVAAVALI